MHRPLLSCLSTPCSTYMGSKHQNLMLKILNHKPCVRGFEIMGFRGGGNLPHAIGSTLVGSWNILWFKGMITVWPFWYSIIEGKCFLKPKHSKDLDLVKAKNTLWKCFVYNNITLNRQKNKKQELESFLLHEKPWNQTMGHGWKNKSSKN